MRYADTLLTTGEVVVVRARQHWLALLLDARTALALWILALILWGAALVFNVTGTARDALGIAAIVVLVVGVVIFVYHAWQWWAQDYLVTNRRILKVEGILNKRAADSSLEKINDAVLEQNVVGRLLNYGDLDILTAADTAIDRYRMLNAARDFKREMLNQKHALEMEFSYRQMPSPPLRAADDPESGREGDDSARSAMPSSAMSAPPPPPPPPPHEAGGYERAIPDEGSSRASVATYRAAGAPSTSPDAERDGSAVEFSTAPPLASSSAAASHGAATDMPATGSPPPDVARMGTAAGRSEGAGASEAREITQTLSRLADLRDRGALSAEEYEAKKAELLDRL